MLSFLERISIFHFSSFALRPLCVREILAIFHLNDNLIISYMNAISSPNIFNGSNLEIFRYKLHHQKSLQAYSKYQKSLKNLLIFLLNFSREQRKFYFGLSNFYQTCCFLKSFICIHQTLDTISIVHSIVPSMFSYCTIKLCIGESSFQKQVPNAENFRIAFNFLTRKQQKLLWTNRQQNKKEFLDIRNVLLFHS